MDSITKVIQFGKSKHACAEAMRWLKEQDDAEQAWMTCERSNWMIWYVARRGVDRKVLVRIACDCARTVLRFVPEGENRPRLCIETTERWIVGEATIEEVRQARYAAAAAAAAYAYTAAAAAYAAAYDAAAAAAAAAAYADADAAYVADAAADAAYDAADADADAAYAAADDAAAAAYVADAADAARRQANIQLCEIVRKYISYQDIAITEAE